MTAFIERADALAVVEYLQVTRSSAPLVAYITALQKALADCGVPDPLSRRN